MLAKKVLTSKAPRRQEDRPQGLVLLLLVSWCLGGSVSAFGQVTTAPAATTQPANAADDAWSRARREQDRKTIVRFVEHVKTSPFTPGARKAVEDGWAKLDPKDDPRPFMISGIAILSPEYRESLDLLEKGDPSAAAQRISPMVESKDPYIADHAATLLSRCLVEQDMAEEAVKLLTSLHEKREALARDTFLAPEVEFLLGYAQLLSLNYEQAGTTLAGFERQYIDAPEPLRLQARQMLQELAGRQPDGLSDVSDLMTYAGRNLKHARAGEPIQQRQQQAVDLLTKLIEQAEKQEQQQQQQQQSQGGKCKKCGGKGCEKCQGTGKQSQAQGAPVRGAERSVLPLGPGSKGGNLHPSARARPGEQWGRMRPEERERVFQALRQNFPSRYRQLVEQYYKELAKQE